MSDRVAEEESLNNQPTPEEKQPQGPSFRTPLPIRLFLVVLMMILFKMVYDTSVRSQQNQEAISALQGKVDAIAGAVNETKRGVDRLNSGFSDMVKGVSMMGSEVGKSARNVQLIQNDLHDEMEGIRKKVNDIANRVTAVQQDLRNPFRR